MWKKLILVLVAVVLMPGLGYGQDPKAVLDGVAKSMGEVKSLQYAGSGANYSFGQNVSPGTPWPRFNLKSYTVPSITTRRRYATSSSAHRLNRERAVAAGYPWSVSSASSRR
jgi:hypothetical protein